MDKKNLLETLIALPSETEWVEFKCNSSKPDEIGKYLSALSNSASLNNKKYGYLVFGIEDQTHRIKGTRFKPKQKKKGNEELENWLARLLEPRIDFKIKEFTYNEKPIVMFEINPTYNKPVKFKEEAFIRVGSIKKKLKDHPEKERKIWQKRERNHDWSARIIERAAIDDLSPDAIMKAREQYKEKNKHLADDIANWDDITFLNKAKVTKQGKITRTAIILLGKPESDHFISPSVAKISWILKDENNIEKDYEHFSPPFLLNADKVLAKIRNLKYRYMPDGTLFPIEIDQYDNWVIREALHNCIAHQDYTLKGKINLVERPDELIFSNVGSFIPGSIENVITQDAPQEIYRNPFLTNAMNTLNMIDTIGSGIKKMFLKQKNRFFPLPDYDLHEHNRVIVKIQGKILNKNYTQRLIEKEDIELSAVIILDKVQKKIKISKEHHKFLKNKNFVEGRYPNLYVSSKIAAVAGQKAKYIKNRGFDKKYYQDLITSLIEEHETASRKDINELLFDKLPDIMSEEQKMRKINKLLTELSLEKKILINTGSRKKPVWILSNKKIIKR